MNLKKIALLTVFSISLNIIGAKIEEKSPIESKQYLQSPGELTTRVCNIEVKKSDSSNVMEQFKNQIIINIPSDIFNNSNSLEKILNIILFRNKLIHSSVALTLYNNYRQCFENLALGNLNELENTFAIYSRKNASQELILTILEKEWLDKFYQKLSAYSKSDSSHIHYFFDQPFVNVMYNSISNLFKEDQYATIVNKVYSDLLTRYKQLLGKLEFPYPLELISCETFNKLELAKFIENEIILISLLNDILTYLQEQMSNIRPPKIYILDPVIDKENMAWCSKMNILQKAKKLFGPSLEQIKNRLNIHNDSANANNREIITNIINFYFPNCKLFFYDDMSWFIMRLFNNTSQEIIANKELLPYLEAIYNFLIRQRELPDTHLGVQADCSLGMRVINDSCAAAAMPKCEGLSDIAEKPKEKTRRKSRTFSLSEFHQAPSASTTSSTSSCKEDTAKSADALAPAIYEKLKDEHLVVLENFRDPKFSVESVNIVLYKENRVNTNLDIPKIIKFENGKLKKEVDSSIKGWDFYHTFGKAIDTEYLHWAIIINNQEEVNKLGIKLRLSEEKDFAVCLRAKILKNCRIRYTISELMERKNDAKLGTNVYIVYLADTANKVCFHRFIHEIKTQQ